MTEDNKFYQNSKFKTLKKNWYKKLKQSGFEDIEWHDEQTGDGENSSYLKSHFIQSYSTDVLTNKQTLGNSSKFEVQRAIDHFNMHGVFENELDKKLWELYSEGNTYRKMSQELRKAYKTKTSYSVFWVFHRIKSLRLRMIEFNEGSPKGLKNQDRLNKTMLDMEEFDHEINDYTAE